MPVLRHRPVLTGLILSICALLLPLDSPAAEFVREYEFKASDDDSKNSARRQAIEQLQYLLLQEVGTYIDGYAELDGSDSFIKEEIRSITAGTAKTSILDETWDGYRYWVKARLDVDPQEVVRRVNEQVKARANDEALTELKSLLSKNDQTIRKISGELKDTKQKLVEKERVLASLGEERRRTEQQLAAKTKEEQEAREVVTRFNAMLADYESRKMSVRLGMVPEEVQSVLGRSRAHESCAGTIHDNYGDFWVCYESGVLAAIEDGAKLYQSCSCN